MALPTSRLFKVTNLDEVHYGFKYVDGLNKDHLPFAETGDCVPGGLYFTDLEHIAHFYSYGVWIREVTLPKDDPAFRIVRFEFGNKWRANMIHVSGRHLLQRPDTYVRLGIPMMERIMAEARGYKEIVAWHDAKVPDDGPRFVPADVVKANDISVFGTIGSVAISDAAAKPANTADGAVGVEKRWIKKMVSCFTGSGCVE